MAGGATRLRGRRGIGGGALAVFATACLAVAGGGDTIRVASFRSRAQADKLRETLGGEAYVAEIGAGHGAPFRVRVGSFASRAEAEARAVRLRTELPLGAFVTQK